MDLLEVDSSNEYLWEQYLSQDERSLVYYSLEFRDLLVHVTGATPRYWMAVEGSTPVGILPSLWLFGPFGWVANALPFFGSYGSPLASNPRAMAALIDHWDDATAAPEVGSATMIQNPLCVSPYSNRAPTDQRLAAFTDLTGGIDQSPLSKVHSSARRNIHHAQRSGVRVERVDPTTDDYVWLYEQHVANMERVRGRPKPFSFFEYFASRLRGHEFVTYYQAVLDGRRVAAILFLQHSGTLEYITPGITDEGRDLQATSGILAQAMLDAAGEGLARLNWGGTWPTQDGVRRFKRKWATSTSHYHYFTSVRNDDILRSTPEFLQSHYGNFYVVPYGWLNI